VRSHIEGKPEAGVRLRREPNGCKDIGLKGAVLGMTCAGIGHKSDDAAGFVTLGRILTGVHV